MYWRICSLSSDVKGMGVARLMDDAATCLQDAASRCMDFGVSIEKKLKENKKQEELEDEQEEVKQNQFEEEKKHLEQKLRLVYLLGEKILDFLSEMEEDSKLQVEDTFKVITIADLLIKGEIKISKVIPKRDGGFRFGTFSRFEDAHRFSMYLKIKDEDEEVEQDEFGSSFMGLFIGHEAWILEVRRRFVCPPFSGGMKNEKE